MPPTLHQLAEERSLAWHRWVAAELDRRPAILTRARERVKRWRDSGEVATPYVDAWDEILSGSRDEIAARLVEDSERARALRQVTPFAGAIDPRTRWRIWREVRERFERR
jgi:hypothetical protein